MILKVWGDWDLFQTLLSTLRLIGDRHGGLSIANVATRWVLDHSFVGAVIIGEIYLHSYCLGLNPCYLTPGARLGISDHTDDNLRVSELRLTNEDRAIINCVLEKSNGNQLIRTIGDCGAEYR